MCRFEAAMDLPDTPHRDALRLAVAEAVLELNRYATQTGDTRFDANMVALASALANDEREIRTRLEMAR
jgi:hypothetical protein